MLTKSARSKVDKKSGGDEALRGEMCMIKKVCKKEVRNLHYAKEQEKRRGWATEDTNNTYRGNRNNNDKNTMLASLTDSNRSSLQDEH